MRVRGFDAPPLRFLILCGCGWIILRLMMVLHSDAPAKLDGAQVPWADADSFRRITNLLAKATAEHHPPRFAVFALPATRPVGIPKTIYSKAGSPARQVDLVRRDILPAPGSDSVARVAYSAPPVTADMAKAKSFGIERRLSGWSLSGWLYLRDGRGTATDSIGAISQLGGGQGGVRLAYGFGRTGRIRGYGRATVAVQRLEQRELAVGFALAPDAKLPIDVAVEQRIAAGRGGRTALAAMVSGGVSDVRLPASFRLDAYVQAGVVGARHRDGFADGALVIDRPLGLGDMSRLRIGAMAAAAVQPGVARLDVGPRLTVHLPNVGQGGRIALDWRQRIAGDASPGNGAALTLAADF